MERPRPFSLMDRKRQKRMAEADLTGRDRGETPKADGEGSEAMMAGDDNRGPTDATGTMEDILERGNLKSALKRVVTNRGSAGVDGMSVEKLTPFLQEHWPRIKQELLEDRYKPQPVRRVEIPKPDGGMRKLGIPTVLDRLIQQAVMQRLQLLWDPAFSPHSFGFRPGRSAHQAVAQAQAFIAEGYPWVVDIDLEKFFDRVNHDILMSRVAKRVKDKRVLRLIRAYLNAGVMEDGLVSRTDEGTPQGGPLSPLLSNIVLDDLDRELERRGHRFVRYADDCNIYVRSRKAGERVMAGTRQFITKKLKLKVNEEKSAVARPPERKFLGFSFTSHSKPKRRIAPKALKRVKDRIRELTRRTIGRSLKDVIAQLGVYLIGWRGYFGFCETPSVLKKLDSWIHRRLRSLVWKQWKRGKRRYKELRRRGVENDLAAKTAGSSHGPWRISRSPALHYALPIALLTRLGLPRLAQVKTV
jgi:RNA-directed DNA polymerase